MRVLLSYRLFLISALPVLIKGDASVDLPEHYLITIQALTDFAGEIVPEAKLLERPRFHRVRHLIAMSVIKALEGKDPAFQVLATQHLARLSPSNITKLVNVHKKLVDAIQLNNQRAFVETIGVYIATIQRFYKSNDFKSERGNYNHIVGNWPEVDAIDNQNERMYNATVFFLRHLFTRFMVHQDRNALKHPLDMFGFCEFILPVALLLDTASTDAFKDYITDYLNEQANRQYSFCGKPKLVIFGGAYVNQPLIVTLEKKADTWNVHDALKGVELRKLNYTELVSAVTAFVATQSEIGTGIFIFADKTVPKDDTTYRFLLLLGHFAQSGGIAINLIYLDEKTRAASGDKYLYNMDSKPSVPNLLMLSESTGGQYVILPTYLGLKNKDLTRLLKEMPSLNSASDAILLHASLSPMSKNVTFVKMKGEEQLALVHCFFKDRPSNVTLQETGGTSTKAMDPMHDTSTLTWKWIADDLIDDTNFTLTLRSKESCAVSVYRRASGAIETVQLPRVPNYFTLMHQSSEYESAFRLRQNKSATVFFLMPMAGNSSLTTVKLNALGVSSAATTGSKQLQLSEIKSFKNFRLFNATVNNLPDHFALTFDQTIKTEDRTRNTTQSSAIITSYKSSLPSVKITQQAELLHLTAVLSRDVLYVFQLCTEKYEPWNITRSTTSTKFLLLKNPCSNEKSWTPNSYKNVPTSAVSCFGTFERSHLIGSTSAAGIICAEVLFQKEVTDPQSDTVSKAVPKLTADVASMKLCPTSIDNAESCSDQQWSIKFNYDFKNLDKNQVAAVARKQVAGKDELMEIRKTVEGGVVTLTGVCCITELGVVAFDEWGFGSSELLPTFYESTGTTSAVIGVLVGLLIAAVLIAVIGAVIFHFRRKQRQANYDTVPQGDQKVSFKNKIKKTESLAPADKAEKQPTKLKAEEEDQITDTATEEKPKLQADPGVTTV